MSASIAAFCEERWALCAVSLAYNWIIGAFWAKNACLGTKFKKKWKKFAKNLAERKKRRIFALAYKNKGV